MSDSDYNTIICSVVHVRLYQMKDIHLNYRTAYSDYLEKICGCVYNTKSSFQKKEFAKQLLNGPEFLTLL